MPSKRAHTKSRTGCRVCRQRRVKCDEVHPVCGPCKKHNVECTFDRVAVGNNYALSPGQLASMFTRSRGQTPPTFPVLTLPSLTSTPSNFGQPTNRIVELQLLNHYTYMHMQGNHEHSPRLKEMWAYSVPQTALGSEVLMDAVFSMGAQHLHINRPHDQKMRLIAHRSFARTLRGLNEGFSRMGPHNVGNLFAASIMVAVQTFLHWKDPCVLAAPYRVPVEFLVMSKGILTMFNNSPYDLHASVMRPMLELCPASPTISARSDWHSPGNPFMPVQNLLDAAPDDDPGVGALKEVLADLRSIYVALQEGESAMITRRRLMRFPVVVPQGYIDLLRAEDARATVLLAHYFAIMKEVEDVWWFQGRADFEIPGMMNVLPEAWHPYMAWPLRVLQTPRPPARPLTPQPRGLSPYSVANSPMDSGSPSSMPSPGGSILVN